MKAALFALGLAWLTALEFARVYFIMPFPGSQQADTVGLAFWLHGNAWWLRIAGAAVAAYPAFVFARSGRPAVRWLALGTIGVWLVVAYLVNFRFLAEKMFYQPRNLLFADGGGEIDPDQLVLGISIDGEEKAYPLEIIGYHHQVRDTVGGEAVMVTYCTVCRSGRVFRPVVNGSPTEFRLVGMDRFNAMFEDAVTRSWWRQANGVAVAGPSKGDSLPEVRSSQTTLSTWLALHPDGKVMQPDVSFLDRYVDLEYFDEGTINNSLEGTDRRSWQEKSWVVGVVVGSSARAYDWNHLLAVRAVNDTLGGQPVLVAIGPDSASFHAWSRTVNGDTVRFVYDAASNSLRDARSGGFWHWSGSASSGDFGGTQLQPVQSYQEFWHSWRTFRDGTSRYLP